MKLILTLEYHGWLNIELTDDAGKHHRIPASFLTDVICDILEDATNLIMGSPETITVVQSEPNESRIRIQRRDAMCTFEVLGFNDNFSTAEIDQGICDFKTQISLTELARQIWIEINKLRDFGKDEYERVWGYVFPDEAYERFEQSLKTLK